MEEIKEDVFDEVVNSTIEMFKQRFDESAIQRYQFVAAFMPENIHKLELKDVKAVMLMYDGDFPEDSDDEIIAELNQFKTLAVESNSFFPKDGRTLKDLTLEDVLVAMVTLKMDEADGDFRNIFRIYFLLLLLPVSSAGAERSFSCMKIVKTRLRTQMNQDVLTNLMILCVNRDIAASIQPEQILKHWYEAGGESRKEDELFKLTSIAEPNRRTRKDRYEDDRKGMVERMKNRRTLRKWTKKKK
jgi:hypothetical protein